MFPNSSSKPTRESAKRRGGNAPTTGSKKRPRQSESSGEAIHNSNTHNAVRNDQAKVPVIDNVSANVAPLLLQAVKSLKKFITKKHKLSQQGGLLLHNHNTTENQINKNSYSNSNISVQEAIFQRMDDSIQQNNPGPLQDQLQDTEKNCKSLLEAIDRESSDLLMNSSTKNYDLEDLPVNCATGCLDFLIDLLADDTCKIILRHAALLVIRCLTQHRHDCRISFTAKVKIFVDSVGDSDEHLRMNANRKLGTRDHVAMYQKDALQFLHDLSGWFDSTQPRLVIAGRYLEEQKGISLNGGSHSLLRKKTNADMIELRKIRDKALMFAEKEVNRINKVLKVMDSCFDILFPRFGHQFYAHESSGDETAAAEPNKSDNYTESIFVADDEEDEDIDDDIDWEDGDENGVSESKTTSSLNVTNAAIDPINTNSEDRLTRVERTLAVMKQSGALRNDGTLEVELGNDSQTSGRDLEGSSTEFANDDSEKKEESRKKMSKCVEFLTTKVQKLSLWIEAILSADNMTDASRIRSSSNCSNIKRDASSVVLLPESIRKKKATVTKMLVHAKDSVTRALAAEARMKKSHNQSVEANEESDARRQDEHKEENESSTGITSWQEALGVNHQTEANLIKALSLPKHVQKKKSHKSRLQIKLRK